MSSPEDKNITKQAANDFNEGGKPFKDNHVTPSIVIVQDDRRIQDSAQFIAKKLENKHGNLDIYSFPESYNLKNYLEESAQNSERERVPTTFFLDCCGAGHKQGLEIIKWFEEHRADEPAPEIYFISLDTHFALEEAARLSNMRPHIKTGFVDSEEMHLFKRHLDGDNTVLGRSRTKTFREVLGRKLNAKLPLTVGAESYKTLQDTYEQALQGGVFEIWKKGGISTADVIEKFRTYTMGLAQSVQTGLYTAQGKNIKTDASFYEGAGFPVKGTVTFSITEVENWPLYKEHKPILIMQSYDPSIVPLLESGKLGGLIVCDTYLASHLTFICEEKNVSGVFGLMAKNEQNLKGAFNEMSKSNLAPYFSEPRTEINGTMIEAGQDIMIGVGDNGIAFEKNTLKDIEKEIAKKTSKDQEKGQKLNRGGKSILRSVNKCFDAYFSKEGLRAHKIKVNINSPENEFIDAASGIGLIRTEQMAAMDERQAKALRDVLLLDKDAADKDTYCHLLQEAMLNSYRMLLCKTDKEGYQVKFRLFDLSPKELFNSQEQAQFHERYKSMDIHGGQALETWPQLYKDQIEAIFKAYSMASRRNNKENLQVMMPAVRTEADVLQVKEMLQGGAKTNHVREIDYQFGVMIETLDSCNNAEDIIKHCDFISFGTNDLTQQVLNIPRDNLKMRAKYKQENGFDPYKKIAPEVMEKIRDVCIVARRVNPEIEIDICGGQAADMDTALKLFDAGVDNLSVAPNKKNIYALPFLLNYQRFDQMKPASKNINPPNHAARKT